MPHKYKVTTATLAASIASLLVQVTPLHAANMSITINQPNAIIAVPSTGTTTITFSGTVKNLTHDQIKLENYVGNHAYLTGSPGFGPVLSNISFPNLPFSYSADASYTGPLLSYQISNSSTLGSYTMNYYGNPIYFSIFDTDMTTHTATESINSVPLTITLVRAVPEPSAYISFSCGLLGLISLAWRRRQLSLSSNR